jgi:hypothetical protein
MRHVLRWAGQNGAVVVIAGVVIGLCIPFLSELARPYLAVAIFIFTFGSFLKFDGKSVGSEFANVKRNLLMVLWATFGVPLVIFLITIIARPGPELAQGLLFWALVPVSPACVAFAAILRLNIPIALLATVLGTAASPFYIPALAALFGGYRLDIDPIATCMRLVLLVGVEHFCHPWRQSASRAHSFAKIPKLQPELPSLRCSSPGWGLCEACKRNSLRSLRPALYSCSWLMCCCSGRN